MSSPSDPSILKWWPILVLCLGVAASTVRAEGQNAYQEDRINYLYQKGSPAVVERLARIETGMTSQGNQLDRIERKLDQVMEQERTNGRGSTDRH